MPSAWDQFFLPVNGADRNSAEFWNPSRTIDGVAINYGDSQSYNLPGVQGLVPGRFREYAQTHPDRWNRLWDLGSSVLAQIPQYSGLMNRNPTISMFAENFLRNGAAGLADLWANGSQTRNDKGALNPWDISAPVPRILNQLLGLDISNQASNAINAANGSIVGVGGLPAATRYQLAAQSRGNRSVNDIILGIGQDAPAPAQAFDGAGYDQAASYLQSLLSKKPATPTPPGWYGSGNRGAETNYGSPY